MTAWLQLNVVFENASLERRLLVIVSLNRQPRGCWPLPREVRNTGAPHVLYDLPYILANTHTAGGWGGWAGLKLVLCQIKKIIKKFDRLLQAARKPSRCLGESL